MAGDPDRFRVSPSLTNLPMVVAPPVENAGPRQMVEAGQAIQRAGAVASSLYEDVLKEQNQTRVTEALTQLTERRNEMTHGEAGWAAQLGKNALERPDGKSLDEEFGSEFDNTIENIELGLGNDAQKRMFRENASRMSLDLRGRIQAHVSDQDRVYKIDTYTGQASTFRRQLALATNEREIGEAREGIRTAAEKLFSLKGTPPDAQGEVLRELYTPGHAAQLDKFLANEDYESASAYMQKYRDDITADVETKLTAQIAEQQALSFADDVGTAEFDRAFGSGAPGAPPVKDDLVPVAKGGSIIQQVFGNKARITSTYRPPDHALSRANPKSWHTKSKAAVDMAPIPGMTFEQAKAQIEGQGYHLIEAKNEVGGGRSAHATGDHWHFVLGTKDGKNPTPSGPAASGSLEDAYRRIDEREDLSDKQKTRAKAQVRELRQARDYDRQESEEQLLSKAYGEAGNGAISRSTEALLVSRGMGSSLPSLRSFAAATKERAAGKVVNDDDGLVAYGAALVSIADGNVDGLSDLLRVKPYVSDSQYKQLTDAYTKSPRDTQSRVSALVKELDIDAKYSGVFEDEDGNFDKKKYQRYVGAVESTIREREEVTGKLLMKDERRQIVLGLLAERAVSGDGDRARLFDVRVLYDNIPVRARQEIMRGLRKGGVAKPQITDVVRAWRSTRKVDQDQYR